MFGEDVFDINKIVEAQSKKKIKKGRKRRGEITMNTRAGTVISSIQNLTTNLPNSPITSHQKSSQGNTTKAATYGLPE